MVPGPSDAAPEARARNAAQLLDAARRHGVRGLDDARLARLAPLLACDAPAMRLRQRPRTALWLALAPDAPRTAHALRASLLARTRPLGPGDEARFDRILRRFRHRELARIALRDLTRRARLSDTVRELSHLADALVEAAVRFHDRALAARHGPPLGPAFCVLAMGKHGAEELNYSSDIDVMFVVDDAVTARERALLLARHVMRSLSDVTEDGFAFRVDANLRPYGRDGALVLSADEYERYYERAGQAWERAALIKARPCAGGLALGEELVERLRPFVYRRSLDLGAVEAVAQMKGRIDRAREALLRDDVKLGPGGIREIEFFAQALQLLHGGRQPRLRVRATLAALDALVYAGHLPLSDRDALAAAYVFLRDVEHRVQLPGDEQTHAIPPAGSPAGLALALRMAFTDEAAFRAELTRHRTFVHGLFSRLLETAAEKPAHSEDAARAVAAESVNTVRDLALARLGFAEPEVARATLHRLARQDDGAFGPRGRERHPGLAERLVDELARSPAPDQALARLARLSPPLWDAGALATLLSANPATARLLVLLFATSDTLSADFERHPELLDLLVRADAALLDRPRASLAREADERLAGLDVEAALGLLRRLRHEETLRIGLHDLAGRLDPASVGAQLTSLAEVLVDRCLDLARRETARRWGEPAHARLAVLGLGSFGGAELGYESDLDLVFVHDASGPTSGGERGAVDAAEWAARVGQRLLHHLTLPMAEGILYRVDTRLRPSGSSGPLVAGLGAFAAYHRGDGTGRGAALWERQALLRARVVAGDASLQRDIDDTVLDVVARMDPPPDAGARIAEMRGRLDARPPHGIDPKKGPGGLVDVEFAVQRLLIAHRLREASTRAGLERLRRERLLADDDARRLLDAWLWLRRIESRLRLVYGRAEVYVPTSGPGLDRLARQLGDAAPDGGGRLLRQLLATMARTREDFERWVGPVAA